MIDTRCFRYPRSNRRSQRLERGWALMIVSRVYRWLLIFSQALFGNYDGTTAGYLWSAVRSSHSQQGVTGAPDVDAKGLRSSRLSFDGRQAPLGASETG